MPDLDHCYSYILEFREEIGFDLSFDVGGFYYGLFVGDCWYESYTYFNSSFFLIFKFSCFVFSISFSSLSNYYSTNNLSSFFGYIVFLHLSTWTTSLCLTSFVFFSSQCSLLYLFSSGFSILLFISCLALYGKSSCSISLKELIELCCYLTKWNFIS